MKMLFCDSETFSRQPITDGTHKYTEHESTESLLWSYAFDMKPVKLWDAKSGIRPLELAEAWQDPDVLKIAFNVPFDRGIIENVEGIESPLEQWMDAQILAYALGFSGGLDMVLQQIGFPQDQQKNKDGKQLINRFCSPAAKNHKADRYDKHTHPEEWERFKDYAIQDTEVLRQLWIWCATQNPTVNWDDWRMAERTNLAGIPVDLELCQTALDMHTHAKAEIKNTLQMATGLDNPLSNQQMRGWLSSQDIDLPNLAADTLNEMDEKPPELVLYSKAVSTAPTKYKAFIAKACKDGTVKGAHQFIGASRSGRDASRGINTQNLKRGPIDIHAPELILKGQTDIIAALYGDVIDVLATSVRAAIAAPKGKTFLISDLAGIEGRVLPWLCHFQVKLEQISGGMDMYKVAACSIYHTQYEKIDKSQRFVGKVAELALGYQGAVGAFSSMASAYGTELPEDEVKTIVKEWRESNYPIVQFWYELERMAIYTITTGEVSEAGRIKFSRTELFLVMHLPSGRNLYYYQPEMVKREVHGSMKDQISYMGLNTYTRKWERTFTYGGKLAENATQGVARDVFYHGYRRADAEGIDVRLRVHDELVCVGEPEQLPLLISCMEELPPWAAGLPLKAEGEVSKRYKK